MTRASDPSMARSFTTRLRSFDYRGFHRTSWTLCTWERQRCFTSSARVTPVLSSVQRAADDEGIAVLAYCVMPDHVHLVVAGKRPDSNANAFVGRAKQRSGYWYRREYGRPLWQRSSW